MNTNKERWIFGDESCKEFLENERFRPNNCLFCGETPIVFVEEKVSQVRCQCGSYGPISEWSSMFSVTSIMALTVQEWNRVHSDENFERMMKEMING